MLAPSPAAAQDTASLWAALAGGGHVALMRHALAPGIGDPAEFQINDCATQRNLNDEGRAQARRTGDAFRRNGVVVGRLLSSEWCRCLETAALMKLAKVESFAGLNSFFEGQYDEDDQTRAVRDLVSRLDPKGRSLVMVTHQVNISALTGGGAQSGAIVVLKLGGPGGFEVRGTIPPQ
ncbi:MAG: histidine phosphatase family protein [Alphaproteobacteria bacterium]|nr:histidine phosphatase family protein [Alphaproteobacteria bacterium]